MKIYVDWYYKDWMIISTVLYDYRLFKFCYEWLLQIEWINIRLSSYVAELMAVYMAFLIIEKNDLKNFTLFTDNVAIYWVLNGFFNTRDILTYRLLNYFKTVIKANNIKIEKIESSYNLADLNNAIFLPLKEEVLIDRQFFKKVKIEFVELTIEDLYQAYRKAKKGKTNRKDFLLFEQELNVNLEKLYNEIINKTYRIWTYKCFIKKQRKYREIFMLDVKDIIVQHLILLKIWDRFERSFIYDAWNHRIWKWIHWARKRLRYFIRSATNNFDRDVWYMKIDIKWFFFNVNRWILRRFLFEKVKEEWIRYLLDQFLLIEPTKYFKFINWTKFEDIKKLKRSLFKVKSWKWLPLWNVISQFFASVYLDKLDKFVKHKLKVKYYLRYSDDIVILHESKEKLKDWKQVIKKFLKEELDLTLSTHKTYIRHTKKWIRWLWKKFFRWNKEKLLFYHFRNFNKNINLALWGKKNIQGVLNGYKSGLDLFLKKR